MSYLHVGVILPLLAVSVSDGKVLTTPNATIRVLVIVRDRTTNSQVGQDARACRIKDLVSFLPIMVNGVACHPAIFSKASRCRFAAPGAAW